MQQMDRRTDDQDTVAYCDNDIPKVVDIKLSFLSLTTMYVYLL